MTKYQGTVLVAASRAATLLDRKAGLSRAGFAVETANNEGDAIAKARRIRPSVALIEGEGGALDIFRLCALLRADPKTAALPIMVLEGRGAEEPAQVDDVVIEPAADAILVARMRELVRLTTMQDEANCRARTAKQFGVASKDSVRGPQTTRRALIVGGSPETAQSIAAACPNYEIVREENPYLAGHRREGDDIDAVVVPLDHLQTMEHQLYFCRHARRNTRYFNMPILLLAAEETFASPAEPYVVGASVALPLPLAPAAFSAALERLVARQVRRRELRAQLVSTLAGPTQDALEGVYSREFLHAHLHNQIEERSGSPRPLSLLIVEIANVPALAVEHGPEVASHIMQQAADFLCGLVRVEDMCARLSESRLLVSLPDGDEAAAQRVAERVAAVLEHTEFGLGAEATEAVGLWVETGVATLEPGDSADTLITRAYDASA